MASALRPPMENPEKSRVVGKVGYGVMPKGPKAQAAGTFGDGLGVVAASEKKEAAYLFCQWAISHDMGARLLQAGAGVPFRQSVLEDPKVREGVTMPGELARCRGRLRQDFAGWRCRSSFRSPSSATSMAWPHQHDRRRRSGRRS